ncbi:MAG: hypothetical protein ACRD0L_01780 [Acidimicrobiales bacterium]
MTVGDCPEGRSPAAPAPLDRAALLALPKVELHVHLEGSFTPERVAELASAAGEALPATLDALLRFDDLPSFLRRLDWWCGLVRSPGQAMEQARQFAGRLASDGVAYAETGSRKTHIWGFTPVGHTAEAMRARRAVVLAHSTDGR